MNVYVVIAGEENYASGVDRICTTIKAARKYITEFYVEGTTRRTWSLIEKDYWRDEFGDFITIEKHKVEEG